VRELLRKHAKIIMTVVSVALMFVFALPTFRQQTSREREIARVGLLDGKKVTNDDILRCNNEIHRLRELGFLPRQGATWIDRFAGEDNQTGLYWYLLNIEAAKYTYAAVTPEQAVNMAVDNLKAEKPETTVEDVRYTLESTLQINEITLARTVSRLQTVYSYLNLLMRVPQPISQFELTADRELREVEIRYVPVNPLRDWNMITDDQISADKVTAQFEAYKNILPTPVLAGPVDSPLFLGTDEDATGPYALIGYPADAADVDHVAHVHAKETIAWDGSKIDNIFPAKQIGLPYSIIIISGGGRSSPSQIPQGLDLHGHAPPELPVEINGHHFPFGYRFPDRVKVEYLVFRFADLRKRLTATEANVIAASNAFKNDPFKYRPDEDPNKPATQPATGPSITVTTIPDSQPAPASAPATRDAKDILKDYDNPKVRQPYIDAEIDKSAAALLRKMVAAARDKAEAPWKNNVDFVDKSKWIPYGNIAAALKGDSQFLGSQPEVATTGPDFLSARDLQALPGLGRAFFATPQGQIIDFPALATNIQELFAPDVVKRLSIEFKREPTNEEIAREIHKMTPLGRLNVPLGQEPQPDLVDKDGNMYLFRATECQAAHVPASLDDKTIGDLKVRDNVLADCKKLFAFQEALKSVQASLAQGDLDALAKQNQSKVYSPRTFNRNVELAPIELRYIQDFVTTAFDLPDPVTVKGSVVSAMPDDHLLRLYPLILFHVHQATGTGFRDNLSKILNRQYPDIVTFRDKYLQLDALSGRLKYQSDTPPTKKRGTP
jgi:hypothetical protein